MSMKVPESLLAVSHPRYSNISKYAKLERTPLRSFFIPLKISHKILREVVNNSIFNSDPILSRSLS